MPASTCAPSIFAAIIRHGSRADPGFRLRAADTRLSPPGLLDKLTWLACLLGVQHTGTHRATTAMKTLLGEFQRLAGAELSVMRYKPPDRSHATGAVPLWISAQRSPVGLALTSGSHDAVLRSSKAEAIAGRPTFLPFQHTAASSPHRRHVAALSPAGSCQDCLAPQIITGELPLRSSSTHSVQCAARLCPVDGCSCNHGRPFASGRVPSA
jgi:hypothetical protein